MKMILKIIGWVLIPYIMIFIFWKELSRGWRIAASIYSAIFLWDFVHIYTGGNTGAVTTQTTYPSSTVNNAPSATLPANTNKQNSDSSAPVSTPQPQDQDSELQAMLKAAPAPTVVRSDVDVEVTYTLTNNTNDTFNYVELDVDFYNKAGVKIENAMTNTTHVTPGQKFQLQVVTMNTEAESFKVTGIYSDSLHN